MIKRNFHRRRSDGDCSSRVKDSRKSVSDRKIAREFLFGIRLEFNFFSFGSVIARELIFSSFRPFEFITIIIIYKLSSSRSEFRATIRTLAGGKKRRFETRIANSRREETLSFLRNFSNLLPLFSARDTVEHDCSSPLPLAAWTRNYSRTDYGNGRGKTFFQYHRSFHESRGTRISVRNGGKKRPFTWNPFSKSLRFDSSCCKKQRKRRALYSFILE